MIDEFSFCIMGMIDLIDFNKRFCKFNGNIASGRVTQLDSNVVLIYILSMSEISLFFNLFLTNF